MDYRWGGGFVSSTDEGFVVVVVFGGVSEEKNFCVFLQRQLHRFPTFAIQCPHVTQETLDLTKNINIPNLFQFAMQTVSGIYPATLVYGCKLEYAGYSVIARL